MKFKLKGILAAFLSASILFSVPASASSLSSDKNTSNLNTSATVMALASTETTLCQTGNFTYSIPKEWKSEDNGGTPYYYYNSTAFFYSELSTDPKFKTYNYDEFIEGVVAGIENNGSAKVEEKENITVNTLNATKLKVKMKLNNSSIEAQFYIFPKGQDMFVLNFAQVGSISDDFQVYINQIINSLQYASANS